MKKLLLLILLIAFSYNESKAQDSVTVTFRLSMYFPNGTYIYDSIIPGGANINIFGNLLDLNATAILNNAIIPLQNFSIGGNLPDWYDLNNDPTSNIKCAKVKFPNSSIGQELKFGFSLDNISFNPVGINLLGENIDFFTPNSSAVNCFSYSPELVARLAEISTDSFYNVLSFSNVVRTILIPSEDATFSFCWSSCLQCNGDAPTSTQTGNLLKSNAFIDFNNNSTIDENEPGAQGINIQINTTPNPTNGFTGNSGRYSVYVPNGDYTVQVAPSNQFTIANASQNVSVADGTTEVFFPVNLAPNYYEIEAVYNPAQMVAGFDQTSSIVIQNTGNSVSNLSFTIILPDNQTFVSSNPAPTNIAGGVITYLIPSIAAYTNFPISITTYLPPPPTFMPGDEITWNLNLSPLPNEESDANNVFSYTLPILSSYDRREVLLHQLW
jgi:hypothetical protein